MESIELRIPKPIQALVSDEQDRLLRSALRVAAKQRARELAKERHEALTQIHRYERKYGASLLEFERKKLRALKTVDAHEDYNDWFFWTTVLERANRAADAFKQMESVA
jgi:hypothetical protein